MTRIVLENLSAKGLRFKFLTVTLRDTVFPYDERPDFCHLQVHKDLKKSTIASAKSMRRSMECYGDLSNCYFPSVFKEKTGLRYEYDFI